MTFPTGEDAGLVLQGLQRREAFWRERLGDAEYERALAYWQAQASFTCPRCDLTSHNPNDVQHGYCGNCHDFTVWGTCRHCGDGTELGEDPKPDLCYMCAKAGRT